MAIRLNILLVCLFFSCSTPNNKTKYFNDFELFIEELEERERANNIDSLKESKTFKFYLEEKDKFRLSNQDVQKIDELTERFKAIFKESEDIGLKVNFYFENSASMNGYLEGTEFLQVMNRVVGNIQNYDNKSFFVNSKEHQQSNILEKINKKQIKVGDISNSDHQFIFSNAINSASENNSLSIVVTDGIYSVTDGNIDIVPIKIEQAFQKSLKHKNTETVVIKLTSKFNGTYYSETCQPGKKAIKINQRRPYYMLLFGDSSVVDKALHDIVNVTELPGYNEQARFLSSLELELYYTILSQGEEKIGHFKPAKRGSSLFTEIIDVEKSKASRYSKGENNENVFQFGVAVDFSNIDLPNSYLEDLGNYSISEEMGYEILDIQNIDNVEKTSRTYKELNKIQEANKVEFTHIITVSAQTNLFGELEISLNKNLPEWIKESGTTNDCEIKGEEKTTFAFDQLIQGISKAYQKKSNKSNYLTINLKIKI